MGVFPADHVITKPKKYAKLLKPAFKAAEAGNIAVLGIQPRWPETGYGYIEFGKGVEAGSRDSGEGASAFARSRMLKTAKKFVAAGRFFWNAGMFFWKAETCAGGAAAASAEDLDSARRRCRRGATAISRRR